MSSVNALQHYDFGDGLAGLSLVLDHTGSTLYALASDGNGVAVTVQTVAVNHTYSAACKQNPNPPVQNLGGGCKLATFTPGIYNALPKISGAAANGTTYFFPSGIYYFDNVGNININGTSGQTNTVPTPAARLRKSRFLISMDLALPVP